MCERLLTFGTQNSQYLPIPFIIHSHMRRRGDVCVQSNMEIISPPGLGEQPRFDSAFTHNDFNFLFIKNLHERHSPKILMECVCYSHGNILTSKLCHLQLK
jgi:hypothetical protein